MPHAVECTNWPDACALHNYCTAMMTIAITGGTGFIGRALVDAHLRLGNRVRVLTRRPGFQPKGAVAFAGDLASAVPTAFVDGADMVFHLAAELSEPARMQEVNVRGTQRLLKAAIGRCGRWIQMSSVGVYGAPGHGIDTTESTPPRPGNSYEQSKLQADLDVARTCAEARCPWAILRPSNVVGAAMQNQSAFALVRAIVRGRFAYVGRRDAISTYVHVDDVVHALLTVSLAPSGTVANVSSDCSWTALVQRICHRANCREPRIRIPIALARTIAMGLGGVPGFPLTRGRIDSLSRSGGYPIGAVLQRQGFRLMRPMPEGFDEVTDQALAIQRPTQTTRT